MYDVIVVGSGCAGMTAAIYCLRANLKVLVLEAKVVGGQIVNASKIVNYPGIKEISGIDFSMNLYDQVIDLGAAFKYEKVIDIELDGNKKIVKTTDNSYISKSVIIASGAVNKHLGVNGEDKLIGKGVSYCATCDGYFYKDKIVAVQGGGNTALEDVIYLNDIAKKVYLIHRRDSFKAENDLINKVKECSNVEIIYNSKVVSINGNEKLESIDLVDNDNNESNIKVDGIFIAIGQIPDNGNFIKFVNLDKNGYIVTDNNCHSKVDGIFIAGDCRSKDVRQLTTAASDGTLCAIQAINYCKNESF